MASIEDYELENVIGQGGFAQVFAARRRADDGSRESPQVAIKRIDKAKVEAHRLQARVESELRLHWQCRHPNVLPCYCCFEDAGFVYMELRLCAQGNLYQLLHRHQARAQEQGCGRGMPLRLVRAVLAPLVAAVAHLHGLGIIHRDIKLSNVLVEYSYADATNDCCCGEGGCNCCWAGLELTGVFLCDFGLATQLHHPDEEQFTFCGTPNYISPEVIRSNARNLADDVGAGSGLGAAAPTGSYSFPADVWSLGVLGYTCLCGHPPFDPAACPEPYSVGGSSDRGTGSGSGSGQGPASPAESVNGTLHNILHRDVRFPAHMLARALSPEQELDRGESSFAPPYSAALECVCACLRKDPAARPSIWRLQAMPFLGSLGHASQRTEPEEEEEGGSTALMPPPLSPPPAPAAPAPAALASVAPAPGRECRKYWQRGEEGPAAGARRNALCVVAAVPVSAAAAAADSSPAPARVCRVVYSFVALPCRRAGRRVERQWCCVFAHNLPTAAGSSGGGFSVLHVARMSGPARDQLRRFVQSCGGDGGGGGGSVHSSQSSLFSACATDTCASSSSDVDLPLLGATGTQAGEAGLRTGHCLLSDCLLLPTGGVDGEALLPRCGKRYRPSERLPHQLRRAYRKMMVFLQSSLSHPDAPPVS